MDSQQFMKTANGRYIRGMFGLILLIALQICLTNKPVFAHVEIIRSEPADGAILAIAPNELQLEFSEPVVVRFSSVQLLDAQNQPVIGTSIASVSNQTATLQVTVSPLKPGTYTVFWKTLSEADGHFSQGFILFSVGQATLAPRLPFTMVPLAGLPPLVEGGLRWANFLLVASMVGALALMQFGLTSVHVQTTEQAVAAQLRLRRQLLRWAAACATGALIVGLGLLAWQIAVSQAVAIPHATWLTQIRMVLTQTHWGAFWLIRQALLLWLSGGLWLLASRLQTLKSQWPFLIIAGRSVDVMIVQALTSHELSNNTHWWLALSNTTLHLLAASVWIGGLIALILFVLPAIRQGAKVMAEWCAMDWGAFSLLAGSSVGVLVASGLFSMAHQVASLDALVTTLYGRLLLGKIAIVLLTGLCGLGNTLLVHPRLAMPFARRIGRPAGWTPLPLTQLPRLIGIEVALGVLIFGITGFLTATAPPRGVEFTIAPADIQRSLGQRVNDLFVTLEVSPNRPGQNLFRVRSVSMQPLAARGIYQVLLRFTPLHENVESLGAPISAIADEVEPGVYQLTGKYLKLAGAWQIEVVTSRHSVGDTVAQFRWTVAPPGPLQPVVWSKHPLSHILAFAAGTGWLLVGLCLLAWRERQVLRLRLRTIFKRDKRLVAAETIIRGSTYPSSKIG
ncbi:copper resistance CopC/CopD family protein [soil metagenome]